MTIAQICAVALCVIAVAIANESPHLAIVSAVGALLLMLGEPE